MRNNYFSYLCHCVFSPLEVLYGEAYRGKYYANDNQSIATLLCYPKGKKYIGVCLELDIVDEGQNLKELPRASFKP